MKRTGILLVNLGTPKDSSKTEVRKYLKTFLSDRRVIKIHPIIWKPILNGIILNIRPKKSAKLYQKICTENGFPLLEYTEKQMENLKNICPEVEVTIGMSYSEPSIETALDTLLSKEIEELNVIPMYPQYSGTTVGSVFDSVMNYFIKSDRIVDIKFIRSFYNNPQYIDYFSKKINEALNESPIDAIVFSYHGIPMSYVKDGDNYPKECTKTTKLIMDKLGDIRYYQTYQSKFGPSEWLKPATDDTLKKLPSKGIKNILIVAPGFVVDCLETIEELEHENRNYFLENGGEVYKYVHPFNGDIEFAKLVKDIISL
ncbi:TPA: ferrochelatase [Enterococcus faecalis]|uniref:Coproporphyrin III ferrochelatase n=8 Tax=Enterococcus faecalis TaxID=1351 RepID=CPFC_ENTFA|nr:MULTISPECIES: ferrochelatase [Enterococcus]Q833G5.1 RecName: Full=Coproporphyrin III ferrochelatase [Enterococcus faecalis V583]KLL26243.1 ferrochelatase [Streptococcus agalactiae]AAO81734.1 ferrochelatase [Enterococcus faecalis V583]APC56197.1 ferrochelatase [Enterococcus faecalis]EEU18166.1 ferrohelatase [Enterococcus faecalis ATCC 4200]EEU74699.1 ferrochelatase [Enterococcus faecalis JH1]